MQPVWNSNRSAMGIVLIGGVATVVVSWLAGSWLIAAASALLAFGLLCLVVRDGFRIIGLGDTDSGGMGSDGGSDGGGGD